MRQTTNTTIAAVCLALTTGAGVTVCALAALENPSVLAWSKLAWPVIVAALAIQFAVRAHKRGESKSVTELILMAVIGNAGIASLGG
jgi:hypothetical protein